MIQINDLFKSYFQNKKEIHSLKNITLTINDNEIVGIIGVSGSGKSTLLKLLSLVEEPTSGDIYWDGVAVNHLEENQRRGYQKQIGMIFQHYHLLANQTVEKNVALPLRLLGRKDPEKVADLLNFVGLAEKAQAYPKNLSGGEKQRVAIARSLVTDPQLLLCDEPTSALDEKSTQEVLELLQSVYQKYQTTIVFVSHEIEVVKQFCQRVVILEAGEVKDIVSLPTYQEIKQPEDYYQLVRRRLQE